MKKLWIGLSLLLIVSLGCKKDNAQCAGTPYQSGIGAVTGPDTIHINEISLIKVQWSYYNGCCDFGHFEEAVDGNTIVIKTVAINKASCGLYCTQSAGYQTTDYTFTPAIVGNHYLTFIQPYGPPIIQTITVVE